MNHETWHCCACDEPVEVTIDLYGIPEYIEHCPHCGEQGWENSGPSHDDDAREERRQMGIDY